MKRIVRYLCILLVLNSFAQSQESRFELYENAYSDFDKNRSLDNALKLAHNLNELEQTEQAISLLTPFLDKEPKNINLLKELSTAYFLEKKFPESGVYLAKILEYYPQSEASMWARDLVASMKEEEAHVSSEYMARFKTGLNSNPAGISTDTEKLSAYITQTNQQDTTALTTKEKDPQLYYRADFIAHFIHDFSDRGGFFQSYGLGGTFQDSIGGDFNDFATLYGTYGLGYSGWLGQFSFPISLGLHANNFYYLTSLAPKLFSIIMIRPAYSFRFPLGDIFSIGFSHVQTESMHKYTSYQYDTNTSTIIGSYEKSVGNSNNLLEMEYAGKFFTSHAYRITFFVGDARMDAPFQSRFSNYRFGGLKFMYKMPLNARINISSELTLQDLSFQEALDPSTVPANYDRNKDIDHLMRHDNYTKIKLAIEYKHSQSIISSLAYEMRSIKTLYAGLEPIVHDISYSLFWLP